MEINEITKIIIPDDKDSICRFCLKVSNDLLLITDYAQKIEWPKAGNLTIHEVFNKLCLKIDYAESLPNGICYECKDYLEDFFVFVAKIESNEEILRKVYAEDEFSGAERCDNSNLSFEDRDEYVSEKAKISHESDELFQKLSEEAENIIEYEHTYGQSLSEVLEHENNEDGNISRSSKRLKKKIKKEEDSAEFSNTIVDTESKKNKAVNGAKSPPRKKRRRGLKPEEEEPVCIKQCFFCVRKFSSDDLRTLHYVEHVVQATEGMVPHRPFCNYCGLLTTKEELDEHIKSKHQNEEDLNCVECGIRFSDVKEVEKHIANHHLDDFEEEIYTDSKCMMCNKIFNDTDEMMKHSLEHIYRRHTCITCKDVFICGAALNEHHKSHPQYNYRCPICKKRVCNGKKSLKNHIATHNTEERNLVCEICNKRYKSKPHFQCHIKAHSRPDSICPHCGYGTKFTKDFVMHMRTHSNERPFKCTFEECGKAFKTNSALSAHVKEHLNIRNFCCEFCDYKTSRSVGLKTHRRIHTGEKPYSCKICHKPFSRKWSLTMHLRKIHHI